MLICCMNYRLFTGMVRWLPSSRDYQYSITLLIVLIGNLIGIIFVSLISSFSIEIVNAAELICLKFINELWYIVLFKGILCGLCITAACQAYHFDGGYIITFLMVMIFVFCGMRHCIADAYYLSVSGMWAAGLLNWLCIVVGNIIGGIIPTLFEGN